MMSPVGKSAQGVFQAAEGPQGPIKGVGGVTSSLNLAVEGAGDAGGVVSLAFEDRVSYACLKEVKQ